MKGTDEGTWQTYKMVYVRNGKVFFTFIKVISLVILKTTKSQKIWMKTEKLIRVLTLICLHSLFNLSSLKLNLYVDTGLYGNN